MDFRNRTYNRRIMQKAKILLALMVFNLALTFPASVYDSFMTSHERFLLQRLLRVLQYLFNPFITLPLLIMGYGSVAMVLVTTGLTIAKLIASIIYCVRNLHIKMRFKNFQLGLLKEMWVFTFFIFINKYDRRSSKLECRQIFVR